MSEPIDARVLRALVREAAGEEADPVDWDAVEDKLLARLDDAPSALGRALAEAPQHAPGEHVEGASDDDEPLLPAVADGRERASDEASSAPSGLEDGDDAQHEDTDVRVQRRRGGSIVLRTVRAARAHEDEPAATIHFPSDDLEDEGSEAADAVHSPSLIHEPPRERRAKARADAEHGAHSRWPTAAAVLSIAAGVALFLAGPRIFKSVDAPRGTASTAAPPIVAERWVDAADVPMAPGLADVRDLSALHAGDVVEATQGAVSFGEKDQLTWTLSPGTRVRIREGLETTSSRHVIVLENGSIRADIVAGSDRVDPFVVEAGDTRVAGYNTVFSVTRSSKGIVVDVEAGEATVGPRDAVGVGSAHVLAAPHRAAVSTDGGLDFKLLDPIRTSAVDPTANGRNDERIARTDSKRDAARSDHPNAAPETNSPSAPAVATSKPEDGPAAPAPSDMPLTQATIRSMLDGCFIATQAKRAAATGDDASSEVTATVQSTLFLGIGAGGTIDTARFNPPLRADLQSCALGVLHRKVEGASGSLAIPVAIKP